jgi:glucose-1-phosphate cytidylyltransferase
MLTYGDGLSNVDLNALLEQHEKSDKTVTITAVQPGGRFGVLEIEGETVTAFKEKSKEDGGWINGGFMVAEPELLNLIDNDKIALERTPLEQLGTKRKLGVYKHYGFWQCMDTQRDREMLENQWENNTAKWKVWDNA